MALKDKALFQENVMHSFSHDFRSPIRRIRVRMQKIKAALSNIDAARKRDALKLIVELDLMEARIIEIGDDLKAARDTFNTRGEFNQVLESLSNRVHPKMKEFADSASNLRIAAQPVRDTLVNELVAQLYNNASRMNRMALAIFDFVNAGERNRPRSEINVQREFERSISDIGEFGDREDVRFNVEGSYTGKLEQFKLALIFQNLLTNALKYRKPNRLCEITLNISVVEQQQILRTHDFKRRFVETDSLEGEYLHLVLRDNGVGIPESLQEHVYDLFTREEGIEDRIAEYLLDSGAANEAEHGRMESSTGVGLAIVKQLVISMRGKTWINSTLDIGTAVHILLPIAN